MAQIKNISTNDTITVRHSVLRIGKPIETCHFEGDDFTTTNHFGLYIDKNLKAIVSVFKNKNTIFSVENQFQLRGMAVLPEFQKNGFGTRLIKHCEHYIQSQNGSLIWFNARENAVPFYEKLGYKTVGNSFFIDEIGFHYVMKKEIG